MPVSVKICGVTDAEHATTAARNGARWLGFVFFEKSPRHLSIDAATKLRPKLPRNIERVGVFVDAEMDYMEQAINALDLDWVQLHGDEYPTDAQMIKNRFGVSVIKAIGVRTKDDIERAQAFAPYVDAILFDAKPPIGADLPGGNALSFPWKLLQGMTLTVPWLLAGGLTANNLAEAIAASGATAADVSSGVEDAPGIKSSSKIEAFLRAAKAVT